jgi:beta-N-acetylhexosaminidase
VLKHLGACAATAALALSGCGAGASDPEQVAGSPSSAGDGAAAMTVRDGQEPPAAPRPLSIERAVGQRLVSGYHGARPTASVLSAVRAGRIGGVILFGENVPTVAAARAAVRALRGAAAAGHQPSLLVMVDQEGGDVKRLAGLPPELSPAQMGATDGPESEARAQGLKTGRALRRLGVNVDLAPVADVPDGPGSFLGTRAFSGTPGVVARGACGFAAGLGSEGVAGSLKHFPGLGRARGNTDLKPVRVEARKSALMTDLAAYRRCGSTVPMVMVSSASYPALGIDGPAVLSLRTYRLLAATGFKGITITDAFDTPAIANQTRPALTALKAGVDLLLYGVDESGAQRAYARLLQDARSGGLRRSTLQVAARRILAFKRRLGAKASH